MKYPRSWNIVAFWLHIWLGLACGACLFVEGNQAGDTLFLIFNVSCAGIRKVLIYQEEKNGKENNKV